MKKNVMLVDDDYIFNYINEMVLKNMNLTDQITIARNGKEAIDLLHSFSTAGAPMPDIIFLDLNMPVMDGFSFIEAFNALTLANKEKISIIIVTSSQDPKDIQRVKKLGVSKYLSKPLSEQQIKTVMEVPAIC